jgi:hypothetical protein
MSPLITHFFFFPASPAMVWEMPQCVCGHASRARSVFTLNQATKVRRCGPKEIVIKDTWVTSAHTFPAHYHLYNTIRIII